MTPVRLYWNNVCILHRQELVFLEKIKEELKMGGIDLQVTCFGLGYPCHMSEYLAGPDAVLPDLVVSADLEVFEDPRIFQKILVGGLHPLTSLFPECGSPLAAPLYRGPSLLPFLAIPLVFYGDGKAFGDGASLSPGQLVREQYPFAFGGIRNSAAKTVAKVLWEEGGPELTRALLEGCAVTDMPIQAFHRVRSKESALALVPSVYALRADGEETKIFCPSGGAVAVASYICARKSAALPAVLAVVRALLAPEISRFYTENGRLICFAPGSPKEPWMEAVGGRLRAPSEAFLRTLDPVQFEEVYNSCLSGRRAS